MADTTLNIKATLTGKLREQVGALRKEFGAWHQQQTAVLRDQAQLASRASSLWDQSAAGAGKAQAAISSVGGALLNVKTLMLGIAAAGASGPIYQKLIGSNADLERAKTTFNVLVGDSRKASMLIAEVRKYAAETPFGESELIEGSKRLLRLTGQNSEQNIKLLKLAGTLAAINPSKTIEDATEAILDAEGQEYERLKEFGIKLKADDVKKSKKKGETLGQAALRGFEEQLNKQTGGRDVVGALGGTFAGQLSTLGDGIGETIRKAGEPAFLVLRRGLGELSGELNNLSGDPKLREEFEAVQKSLASGAESIVSMIKELPRAISFARALKDEVVGFVGNNSGVLTAGAALYGANKLAGGGLVPSVASGAQRLLYGRGAGAGAGAAGAAASDAAAMPVRVVNWPAGGLPGGLPGGTPATEAAAAGGEYITRNTGRTAAGHTLRSRLGYTASTFGAFGSSIASKGALATLGAGGTAAGGAILGLFGAAAAIQLDVMRRTQGVVDAMERKQKLEDAAVRKSLAAAGARDKEENKERERRRATTFGARSYFDAATAPGVTYDEKQTNIVKGLQAAQLALGGSGAKVAGKTGSLEQQRALEEVNKSVGALGIRFGFSKGTGGKVGDRLRVFSGEAALSKEDQQLVKQFREINTLAAKNPEAFAALSSTPEFKQLNKEADSLRARIGRGNQLEGDIRNTVGNVEIGKVEVNFLPGTDPKDAAVIAAQLSTGIEKAMSMVKQR